MRILVTGGGGFLGGAIVRQLLSESYLVRTCQRGQYPELDALAVEVHIGDLSVPEVAQQAVKGCDAVFHVAAKAGVWGSYRQYHDANILSTKNIIEACQYHQVRRLIYTSTPSVVFNGCNEDGIDETISYTNRCFNHYQRTKIIAEKMVLEANSENLATVALRPHLIWGPRDPHLMPRMLTAAQQNRLYFLDQGECMIDCCYIDNAALAHILAFQKLEIGNHISGKAYFISNDEPIEIKKFVNHILNANNMPPVDQYISSTLAYYIGFLLEIIYHIFFIPSEPPMTRFVAKQLSTSHWFKLDNSKQDFNYYPPISIQQGMLKLKQYLAEKNV